MALKYGGSYDLWAVTGQFSAYTHLYHMHVKLTGADFPVKDSMFTGGRADPYMRVWSAKDPYYLSYIAKTVDEDKHTEHMGTDSEHKIKVGESSEDFRKGPDYARAKGMVRTDDEGGFSCCTKLLYDGVTEVQKNTLNPDFPSFSFEVSAVCDKQNDILSTRKSILIEFWDCDGMKQPDFMGFVVVSPCELIKCSTLGMPATPALPVQDLTIPLIKGEKGHAWSGAITVQSVQLKIHAEEGSDLDKETWSEDDLANVFRQCIVDTDNCNVRFDKHVTVRRIFEGLVFLVVHRNLHQQCVLCRSSLPSRSPRVRWMSSRLAGLSGTMKGNRQPCIVASAFTTVSRLKAILCTAARATRTPTGCLEFL